jgi:DNA primase
MDAAREVKDRLAIEDVVGDYVPLKRSGRNFKGLCPFHPEKTPSFMVNPERNIYHCFGCGEGGDALSFVMKMEGLEFREALERLARKAGVDLEQFRGNAGDGKQKDRLRRALDLSIRYYQETLLKNPRALDYTLKARALNRQTIMDFQIGYAPADGRSLVAFLTRRGYTPPELQAAGLLSRDGRDFFRGRLMIPLTDNQGRPVGFTGRKLDEDGFGPKYLNTPQTILYDKGRHIFGLAQAKQAIREQAAAVLAEGNMDVIMSHQAAVRHCVATAGTALTLEQLRQLSRLADKIVLAFDTDKAGVAATVRAVELAQSLPVKIYVAAQLSGKDPDELIRANPADWSRAVGDPTYALDWIIEHYTGQHDLSSGPGKVAFSDALLGVLRRIHDPVEQEHYLGKAAALLGVKADTLLRKLAPAVSGGPSKPAKMAAVQTVPDEYRRRADSLLALLVTYPETRVAIDELTDVPLDFSEEQAAIWEKIKGSGTGDLPETDSFGTILVFKAEELYADWEPKQRAIEAIELAQRLAHETKRRQLQTLSRHIAEAEASGDQAAAQRLLNESRQLTAKEKE